MDSNIDKTCDQIGLLASDCGKFIGNESTTVKQSLPVKGHQVISGCDHRMGVGVDSVLQKVGFSLFFNNSRKVNDCCFHIH